MAEPGAEDSGKAVKKGSKKALLLGLVLSLVLGGAGFYAAWSGLILGDSGAETHAETGAEPLPDIAFVPVEPVTIALGAASQFSQLRMVSQLEVDKPHAADVTLLMPRILDVLNSYLRAVDVAEIEDPASLVRLRAQMLRRVQMVVGDGRVHDLLITEFIVN